MVLASKVQSLALRVDVSLDCVTGLPSLLAVFQYCDDRNGEARVIEVRLSHELYQAAENMYLSLDLPRVITDLISSLDPSLHRRLLSNVILTGGNSRLNGLSFRLVRDLEALLPASLASCVHIVDPRLMTGRSDAVIGAAYVRKWCHATWVTRRDYILAGVGGPPSNVSRSPSLSDDTASIASSSAVVGLTPDNVMQQDADICFNQLNKFDLSSQFDDVENSSADRPTSYAQGCNSPVDESSDISRCGEVISSIL